MFRSLIVVVGTTLLVSAMTVSTAAEKADEKADDKNAKSPLAGEMKLLNGKKADLAEYKGKVVLIVNTASYCGNTPQYTGLEELYKKYKDKDFVVLGFPANEFGKQEPGTDEEIAAFCSSKYKVSFPMFSKIVVKGDGQHELYKTLTDKETNPKYSGPVTWNFEKFLIGRDGQVAARFSPRTKPESEEVVKAIETEIKKEKS
jgi:glutathione peroxidase